DGDILAFFITNLPLISWLNSLVKHFSFDHSHFAFLRPDRVDLSALIRWIFQGFSERNRLHSAPKRIVFEMNSIIRCIFAVLLAVNVANALQCYLCVEGRNMKCTWETRTCPGADTACFKMSLIDPEGYEITTRGCLDLIQSCERELKALKDVYDRNGIGFFHATCTTCQGNKCNSATKLTGFAFFGLVFATAAFLLQ
ncbi:unnamed protein product, partial [Phaedon cochleariae]